MLVPLVGSEVYIDAAIDGHWWILFCVPLTIHGAFTAGYLFNERLRRLGKRGRWPIVPAPPGGWPKDYLWGGDTRLRRK
jgi:hypothetical protein